MSMVIGWRLVEHDGAIAGFIKSCARALFMHSAFCQRPCVRPKSNAHWLPRSSP